MASKVARRRLAAQTRDIIALEAISVRAADVFCADLRKHVAAELQDMDRVLWQLTDSLVILLTEGMLCGHLIGRQRSYLTAGMGFTGSIWTKAVDWARARSNLDEEDLARIRSVYSKEAAKIAVRFDDVVNRSLSRSVERVISEGAHTRQGMKMLNEAFDSAGVGKQNRHLVETLTRTQTQMAYSAGRWEANQETAIDDILWGYEYVAIEDVRVRPSHISENGVKQPKDDPYWSLYWPPNGYNCRCTTIEIFTNEMGRAVPTELSPTAIVGGKEIERGVDRGFGFHPGRFFQTGTTGPPPPPTPPAPPPPTAVPPSASPPIPTPKPAQPPVAKPTIHLPEMTADGRFPIVDAVEGGRGRMGAEYFEGRIYVRRDLLQRVAGKTRYGKPFEDVVISHERAHGLWDEYMPVKYKKQLVDELKGIPVGERIDVIGGSHLINERIAETLALYDVNPGLLSTAERQWAKKAMAKMEPALRKPPPIADKEVYTRSTRTGFEQAGKPLTPAEFNKLRESAATEVAQIRSTHAGMKSVPKKIEFYSDKYIDRPAGIIGRYDTETQIMEFGDKKLSLVRRGVKQGQHAVSAATDLTGTVRHEMGHHLFFQDLTNAQRKRWWWEYFQKGDKWWAKNLSKYGATDDIEGFAEAFAYFSHPDYALGKIPKLPAEYHDLLVAFTKPKWAPPSEIKRINKFLKETAHEIGRGDLRAARIKGKKLVAKTVEKPGKKTLTATVDEEAADLCRSSGFKQWENPMSVEEFEKVKTKVSAESAGIRSRFAGVTSMPTRINLHNADYVYGGADKGIYVHKTKVMHLSAKKRSMELLPAKKGGYCVTSMKDFGGTFRHELGHHVEDSILAAPVKKQWHAIYESHTKTWWKKNLSQYGSTDPHEAFAESFNYFTHPEYGTKAMPKLDDEIDAFMRKVLNPKAK